MVPAAVAQFPPSNAQLSLLGQSPRTTGSRSRSPLGRESAVTQIGGAMSYSSCLSDAKASPALMKTRSEKQLLHTHSLTPATHFRATRAPSQAPKAAALTARGRSDAAQAPARRFDEEFQLMGDTFDPIADACMRRRLLHSLGMEWDTVVEAVTSRGGLNDGIWKAKCREGSSFIMKLVSKPEEASNFRRLGSEHPEIAHDGSVAFPTHIMRLRNPSGQRVYDLIIMRMARGKSIGDVIAERHYAGRGNTIPTILELVGACMAKFHHAYRGKQHGDLQSSNVFYDEVTGDVTLIDIGGMGAQCADSDKDHFTHSLNMLLRAYSAQLEVLCRHSFDRGYLSAQIGGTARLPAATCAVARARAMTARLEHPSAARRPSCVPMRMTVAVH